MKILFIAEYDAKMTDQIMELGEVRMEGFATGIPTKLSEDALKEMAADADIIITSYDNITRGVIDAAPALKLIACTRATPVNIDCGYAAEKGIPVLYTAVYAGQELGFRGRADHRADAGVRAPYPAGVQGIAGREIPGPRKAWP